MLMSLPTVVVPHSLSSETNEASSVSPGLSDISTCFFFFFSKLLRPQRRLAREEDSLGVYNCLAVLAKKISEEQAIVVADASYILKSLT